MDDARHGLVRYLVIDAIKGERVKQDKKWGQQDHEPEVWLAILTEEVGELATAMLKRRFVEYEHRDSADIRAEAVQVAAVAVALIECLDRRMGEN